MVPACQRQRCQMTSLPLLPTHHRQRQPVTHRHDRPAYSLVARQPPVELPHATRPFVLRLRIEHAAAPERVVGDEQPAWTKQAESPLEVGRQRLLVRIEEDRVEVLAVERGKDIECTADAQLDAALEAGARKVGARELCVALIDLDRDEATAGGKPARHPDRRVATQRADLQHALGTHSCEQNLEQAAGDRADGYRWQALAIRGLTQCGEHVVVSREERCDVVVDAVAHDSSVTRGRATSLHADVPRLLEILPRVGAKRGERLRSLDARHLHELLGHHLCDAIVLGDLHDSHEVPLAGHGVDVGDALDAGDPLRDLRDGLGVGANEHDRRDHSCSGNGGTLSNQSPAMRSRSSSSSSRSRANRTTRAGRFTPSLKWIVRSASSASAMSDVSTSTAATLGCDRGAGTTMLAACASPGGASAATFRTSGHTATSTEWMPPASTSRTTHDPSLPASSTEPLIPFPAAPLRSVAVRMSVSGSHR